MIGYNAIYKTVHIASGQVILPQKCEKGVHNSRLVIVGYSSQDHDDHDGEIVYTAALS